MYLAFESGLATRIIHAADTTLETNIVQDVKQRDLPPPPPPPKLERPPVEIPPSDVQINVPVESTSTAITNVTTKHVDAPPPRRTSRCARPRRQPSSSIRRTTTRRPRSA